MVSDSKATGQSPFNYHKFEINNDVLLLSNYSDIVETHGYV